MDSERGRKSSAKHPSADIMRTIPRCSRPSKPVALFSVVGRWNVRDSHTARVWIHGIARPEWYALSFDPGYTSPSEQRQADTIIADTGSASILSSNHRIVPTRWIAASSASGSVMFLITHETPDTVRIFHLNISQLTRHKLGHDIL